MLVELGCEPFAAITTKPRRAAKAALSGGRHRAQAPAGPSTELQDRIAAVKKLVSLDNSDVEAWVELGNLHFDAAQPQEAIQAYERLP